MQISFEDASGLEVVDDVVCLEDTETPLGEILIAIREAADLEDIADEFGVSVADIEHGINSLVSLLSE